MKKSGPLRRGKGLRSVSVRRKAGVLAAMRWAINTKLRDGCCVACGSTDLLEAHHVWPRGRYPDLGLVPENGLTLCRPCHRAWHSTSKAWRKWWETCYPDRDVLLRKAISR